MNRDDLRQRMTCRACGREQMWGPDEALEYLRSKGKFRRDTRPDMDAIMTLFAADPPLCPDCLSTEVVFSPVRDDEGWGEVRCCEVCRSPIQVERLEVFPQTKRCVNCQDLPAEHGESPEFCPKCGAVMQLQHGASGRGSNYQYRCAGCGYRPR